MNLCSMVVALLGKNEYHVLAPRSSLQCTLIIPNIESIKIQGKMRSDKELYQYCVRNYICLHFISFKVAMINLKKPDRSHETKKSIRKK